MRGLMYLSLKAGNIHESEGYIGRQGSCILALKQAKYMILKSHWSPRLMYLNLKTSKIHDSIGSLVYKTHVFRPYNKQRT